MPEKYDYFWDIGEHPSKVANDTNYVIYGGKYWFDKKWEGEVKLNEIHIDMEDGVVIADFVGRNIKDLTDYRPLARFLRWILRR